MANLTSGSVRTPSPAVEPGPASTPNRETLALRINAGGMQWLDELCARRGWSRSQAGRAIFTLGVQAWTEGKRPRGME